MSTLEKKLELINNKHDNFFWFWEEYLKKKRKRIVLTIHVVIELAVF